MGGRALSARTGTAGIVTVRAFAGRIATTAAKFAWFVGVDRCSEYHRACVVDAQRDVVGEREYPHGGKGLAEPACVRCPPRCVSSTANCGRRRRSHVARSGEAPRSRRAAYAACVSNSSIPRRAVSMPQAATTMICTTSSPIIRPSTPATP